MGFRLLPRAIADIEAIVDVIHADSPAAAGRWLDDLYSRFVRLGEMPGIGPARADIGTAVRILPLGQYLILYREERDGADIVRVVHGRRDPESWL